MRPFAHRGSAPSPWRRTRADDLSAEFAPDESGRGVRGTGAPILGPTGSAGRSGTGSHGDEESGGFRMGPLLAVAVPCSW